MTNEIKLTIKLENETEIALSVVEARELYTQLHELFGDCSSKNKYPMVSYWDGSPIGLPDCSDLTVSTV